MPRYKILISYDGTPFLGWQRQPISGTVQQFIEQALTPFFEGKSLIKGASRTDRGVHAEGQVAHFDLEKSIDPNALTRAINRYLPKEIRILETKIVSSSFHARFDAKKKLYRYRVDLNSIQSPFLRLYAHHFPYPLNLDPIAKAIPFLVGEHDFRAFANLSSESQKDKMTTRILYAIDFKEEKGIVTFQFEGKSFLYNMVRNLMGSFLHMGRNRLSLEKFLEAKKGLNRSLLPATAPAKGLCLVQIDY